MSENSTIKVLLRYPNGNEILILERETTLSQLYKTISSKTNISEDKLDLRTGYPPKPLLCSTSSTPTEDCSISEAGIKNGEALSVLQRTAPAAGASSPPHSSSTSPAQSSLSTTITHSDLFEESSRNPSKPVLRTIESIRGQSFNPRANALSSLNDDNNSVATSGGYLTHRIVPDDNSCLFRSAALCLRRSAEELAMVQLRSEVAHVILHGDDDELYDEAVLGKSKQEYCRSIVDKNAWGGAIELAILSKKYATEICSIDVQSGRIDRFGEDAEYKDRIILVYSGIHYDALTVSPLNPAETSNTWPPDIEFDVTSFSCTDDDILRAAVELTTKLREQNYFTDTATFTLKCEICKEGLVGEKEARSHCRETGHTSFGEY